MKGSVASGKQWSWRTEKKRDGDLKKVGMSVRGSRGLRNGRRRCREGCKVGSTGAGSANRGRREEAMDIQMNDAWARKTLRARYREVQHSDGGEKGRMEWERSSEWEDNGDKNMGVEEEGRDADVGDERMSNVWRGGARGARREGQECEKGRADREWKSGSDGMRMPERNAEAHNGDIRVGERDKMDNGEERRGAAWEREGQNDAGARVG